MGRGWAELFEHLGETLLDRGLHVPELELAVEPHLRHGVGGGDDALAVLRRDHGDREHDGCGRQRIDAQRLDGGHRHRHLQDDVLLGQALVDLGTFDLREDEKALVFQQLSQASQRGARRERDHRRRTPGTHRGMLLGVLGRRVRRAQVLDDLVGVAVDPVAVGEHRGGVLAGDRHELGPVLSSRGDVDRREGQSQLREDLADAMAVEAPLRLVERDHRPSTDVGKSVVLSIPQQRGLPLKAGTANRCGRGRRRLPPRLPTADRRRPAAGRRRRPMGRATVPCAAATGR